EVVAVGPEPARDEHDVGALGRAPERVDHVGGHVAHRGVIVRLDVEREQPVGQECLVRVDDLAAQELVADREHLGLHRAAPTRTAPATATPGNAPARRSATTTPRPPVKWRSAQRTGPGLAMSNARNAKNPSASGSGASTRSGATSSHTDQEGAKCAA